MLDFFVRVILGKHGKMLLSFVSQYKYTLMILFIFYGLLLVYAKYVYTVILTEEIEKYVIENHNKMNKSEILEGWQNKKKNMKWYILVPTKNEMFVQHVSKSGQSIQLLDYNKSKYQYDELEKIEEVLKSI